MWGGFPASAFRACNSEFDELLTRYPLIVEASRLLGAMKKESGEPVLLSATVYGSRFDANHRFIPAGDIGMLSIFDATTGEFRGGLETEAQDFKIVQSDGRDVLVLTQTWRGSNVSHSQQIRTQRFRVTNDDNFEALDDKTESLPWPRRQNNVLEVQPPISDVATQQPSAVTTTAPPPPRAGATITTLPTSEQPTSQPWAIVVVMAAAALGCLWFVRKKRAK